MAKKLEDLGLATLPWTAECGYNAWRVLCHGGKCILVDDEYGEENPGADLRKADALLMAAAPRMYEALREVVERHYCCESCSHRAMGYGCGGCKGREYRKILAKASGEEVANG